MGDERPNYVIIENTPGYLPDDDDPPTFDSYAEALNWLVNYNKELSEETIVFPEEYTDEVLKYYNVYEVSPIVNGWFEYIDTTGSENRLPRYVEIVPIDEEPIGG